MKNKTLILTALIILSGCNAPYHVKKARKHTQKALEKGVVIPKDTLTVTKTDTLIETFTKNDSIFTVIRITDTVTLEPTIEIQTRWQTRYKWKEVKVENRAMIDSLKQVVRIERQKKGIAKAENRKSNWWKWLILGIVVGYLINAILAIKSVVNKMNKL